MRLNMKTQKILFSEILAVNFQNKGFLLYLSDILEHYGSTPRR